MTRVSEIPLSFILTKGKEEAEGKNGKKRVPQPRP